MLSRVPFTVLQRRSRQGTRCDHDGCECIAVERPKSKEGRSIRRRPSREIIGQACRIVGCVHGTNLRRRSSAAASPRQPARLLFARHGQSTANLLLVISNRDVAHPLTELGRRQADGLARAVRGEGVQRIFTSPIARARETAEIVGRALVVPVELADALREFDCGIFEGRSDDEAWAAHTAIQREWFELGRPDARIPGGESLTDLRARFVPFVHELARGPLDGSVLLISHGGLLHSLLPEVLDGLDPATVQANPLGNGAIVVADVEPDRRLTCRSWPSSTR